MGKRQNVPCVSFPSTTKLHGAENARGSCGVFQSLASLRCMALARRWAALLKHSVRFPGASTKPKCGRPSLWKESVVVVCLHVCMSVFECVCVGVWVLCLCVGVFVCLVACLPFFFVLFYRSFLWPRVHSPRVAASASPSAARRASAAAASESAQHPPRPSESTRSPRAFVGQLTLQDSRAST